VVALIYASASAFRKQVLTIDQPSSGDGGMVKRLHLGRASEAGVLAASLAADGFEGPRTVLEGEFGFLKVFCTKWDETLLTRGLGEEFLVSTTVLKRYPCHATAHAAVRAVRELQAEHGFSGADVEAITVTGTERMVERHNILEPADLMLAQCSTPFCVALALHREARDPAILRRDRTPRPADPRPLPPRPAGAGAERGARRGGERGHDRARRRPPPRRSYRERDARTRRTVGQIPAPDPPRPRRAWRSGAL
jgi:2-methylcitrate dehydratase PrpD